MREQIICILLKYFALDFHINNVSNTFLINLIGLYLHQNFPYWVTETEGISEANSAYTRISGDETPFVPLFGTWKTTEKDPVPRMVEWWENSHWTPGQHYNSNGELVVTNLRALWTLPLFTSPILGISPSYTELQEEGTFMGLDPRRVMELGEDTSVLDILNSVAKTQKESARPATGYILPEDLNQRIIAQGGMVNVYQYPKF